MHLFAVNMLFKGFFIVDFYKNQLYLHFRYYFMNKLVFATNNKHKLLEANSILNSGFKLLSLSDLNFFNEIPESANTLEENALLKAKFIYDKFQIDCFADDTGLEVDCLNGAPGVYSARYAGVEHDAEKNIRKLLAEMQDKENRKARFRTIIALIKNHETHYFEGKIEGEINRTPIGNCGFGYDSVFIPAGYNKSFAQLSSEEKNAISHRAVALKKMWDFLLK